MNGEIGVISNSSYRLRKKMDDIIKTMGEKVVGVYNQGDVEVISLGKNMNIVGFVVEDTMQAHHKRGMRFSNLMVDSEMKFEKPHGDFYEDNFHNLSEVVIFIMLRKTELTMVVSKSTEYKWSPYVQWF
jgi:hypothetical protein